MKPWIHTIDLHDGPNDFKWDCPTCESNMVNIRVDFLGTHFNEDYCLGVF